MAYDDIERQSLQLHRRYRGKISLAAKFPLETAADLALAYTPGVAAPCRAIAAEPRQVWELTGRGNSVAVVSDGSAVLGLGNIGPLAALPVMEGKCMLFKRFADIDAVPLVLDSQDPEMIINTVRCLAPSFGGINLEDIAAPACFYVENELRRLCDVPVFHDDQHGTAVVALAGLQNALRVVGLDLATIKVVINGAGAAGTAIARFLHSAGAGRILVCDRKGILCPDRSGQGKEKEALARLLNPERETGDLAAALAGAQAFFGLSAPGVLTRRMISIMAPQPLIFALANPIPEIMPQDARAAGAAVVATGRSDFPNQLNNCLAFPGIFRGALDARARDITNDMKLAAAHALASLVSVQELGPEFILPSIFDPRVAPALAAAVKEASLILK